MTLICKCSNCGALLQTTNADPLHDQMADLVKARVTFLGYLQAENACKRTGKACRETCACELELQGLVKSFVARDPVGARE